VEKFGDLPRLGESQGTEAPVDAVQEELGRQRIGAGIGVQEDEVSPRPGGAAFGNRFEREAGQFLGESLRVGNGGRAGDDRGLDP
jgi:hypothetical protein